jgi:hypothetical protein
MPSAFEFFSGLFSRGEYGFSRCTHFAAAKAKIIKDVLRHV